MRQTMNLVLTTVMLLVVQIGFAQQKQISGTVKEADGLTMPGASVVIKGTTAGTSTDMDGNFQLSAKEGDVLTFSFLGYTTKEMTVGASNNYSVILAPEANQMEELVVVGYGVQKKQDVTGAISQIKGEAIENLITPSFEQQLAGRASGVQVTTNGGVIGEAPRIRIRGISSINSTNSPLYVVDGVPLNVDNMSANTDVNPLADINPNDIESFEILKDGSATAIYGSRAANGVILITTKRGKKNSFNVNFGVVTGLGSPMKYYKVLNGDQFTMINQEKTLNAGVSADYWAKYSGINTNWQKEVLRNASSQADYNLGISGGTDKGRYFLSLGYSEQDGAVKVNDLTRYSVRANVEQDINKWLTIGSSLAFTRNDVSAMNKATNTVGGVMINALGQLPNVPVLNPDDPTGYNLSRNANGVLDNEIGYRPWNTRGQAIQAFNIGYTLANNTFKSKLNRVVSNSFLNIKLAEGLTYRFQFGYDQSTNLENTFYSPVHGDGKNPKGYMSQFNLYSEQYNVQNVINYNKTFADKHNLGVTGVYEIQKNTFSYNNAVGRDITSDFFDKNIISGAYATQNVYGSMSENGIKSLVARATYNYENKYYLQGSVRRDGISKLSSDTRWKNLFGYSAGWNVANEEFWGNMRDVVNEFKIRGSYAETGNTGFGNYAYQGLYSLQNYGNANGIAYSQAGNKDLKWETSQKVDFGVDLAFLSNRFRFTVDYFQNTTTDMILERQLPASFGVPLNKINVNAGKMVNKGIEFDFNGALINKNDFSWDINANLTLQKNEVKSLPEEIVYTDNIVREGESLYALYGYKTAGVNPSNGNPIYVKQNGSLIQGDLDSGDFYGYDPANPSTFGAEAALTSDDKFILGSVQPKYFGGITNTFKYKGFDLNFLIRFSGGNSIYNKTRQELMSYDFENNSTEILGRWQSPTEIGDGVTPKVVAASSNTANQSIVTSRFVEKGDFIFLDNVQIGYSLPSNLLSKVNLKKARIFVSGQNLWMITDYKGIDPEMTTNAGVDLFGVPRNRIITLGLNVGF